LGAPYPVSGCFGHCAALFRVLAIFHHMHHASIRSGVASACYNTVTL
jgi:hypothetical protein